MVYTLYTPWEAYPGGYTPFYTPGRHTLVVNLLQTHPGRHTLVVNLSLHTPWEAYPGGKPLLIHPGGVYTRVYLSTYPGGVYQGVSSLHTQVVYSRYTSLYASLCVFVGGIPPCVPPFLPFHCWSVLSRPARRSLSALLTLL